jgi:hypothetical protein
LVAVLGAGEVVGGAGAVAKRVALVRAMSARRAVDTAFTFFLRGERVRAA